MANHLFLLCWFTYMISCLGRFNYSAAMAELISGEGFTKSGVGLIGMSLFIVYGVFQIVTGIAGDKVSPKLMVFFGILGSAIINLLMGFSANERQMLYLWMINGAFQACQWSPIARIFAEILPPEHRLRAVSNIAATIPTATILIYGVAALSIKFWSWRLVFFMPSVVMLIAAFIWYWQMTKIEKDIELRGIVAEKTIDLNVSHKKLSFSHVILASGLLWISVVSLVHGMLKDGIQTWVPSFMTDVFHMSTASSIASAIILPVFNLAGVIFSRWFIKRFVKNELAGSVIFFAVTIFALSALYLIGLSNGVLALVLLTLASSAMIGANILLVNTIPINFGSAGYASTITGILNCSAYAGSALSAYGIGAIADRFGWNMSIFIWFAFAVIAIVICLCNVEKWQVFRQSL